MTSASPPHVARTEHIILTRFNLPTPGREAAIRARPGWLARRFDLFESICLPSVVSQIEQDFLWIIYFDVATPQAFRDRIDRLRRRYPFIPFFTGMFEDTGWSRSLRNVLHDAGRSPKWILTTRLDSDDALSRDYTQRVQQVARRSRTPKALNITRGCIRTQNNAYEVTHPSNAFFSLLEPYDGPVRTAAAIQHMNLHGHLPVTQIDGPPGWLQVVHGDNVSNKIRGRRAHPGTFRDAFFEGALAGVPPPSRLSLLTENTLLTPLRRCRDDLAARRRQPSF